MLTNLEVQTGQGSLLSLPLDDITDGFSVQDIQGLDPVKATIVSSSYATQDGEQYHSARREKRNVVIVLGLEVDYAAETARQLRNRLYPFFMPKSEVTLRFDSDDDPDVTILGRVESFEAPLFTQEPKATISILCFNPDFEDPTPIHQTGTSVTDLTESALTYDGTVETGVVFKLQVAQSISQFSIKNRPTDNQLRSMDFAATLQAGDVVEVNTIPGSKGVYLIRNNTRSSLLYALSPFSDWIQLFPGQNNLRVTTPGGTMPYSIDYTNKYGGL